MLLLLGLFKCKSKLILIADLSGAHATLCLLLVLSLMKNSVLCSMSSIFCLSCDGFGFFFLLTSSYSSFFQLAVNGSVLTAAMAESQGLLPAGTK